jgi:hypothetical protein
VVTRTSTGAFNSNAAAFSAAFGAGAAAGNLGILIVETANQAITTPTGWTLLCGGAGTGFGTAGAAGASMLSIYYRDGITSGEITSGISISDSGDHQAAVLLTYSGHDSNGRGAGAPVIASTIVTNSAATATLATAAIGAAGSMTPGDVILGIVGTDRDSATVSTNSGWSWSGFLPRTDSIIINGSTATGAGGGIIVNEADINGISTASTALGGTITSTAYNCFLIQIFAPASLASAQYAGNPMLPLLCR